MNEQQTIFSQREATIYLGINPATVRKYRKNGYLNPIQQLRKTFLYSKAELDSFRSRSFMRKTNSSNATGSKNSKPTENTKKMLFSQREAAIFLNIPAATLAKFRREGYFKPLKSNTTLIYTKDELDKFKERYAYRRLAAAKN